MKTKNLILTTMMILFTIGMTGCDKDNDRLFDVDEPIGEPEKELTEEEKEMERRYPLRRDDYVANFGNEVISLVKSQIDNPVKVNPVVIYFFETNHNLRGWIYREDGLEALKRVEDLITYLLDEIKSGRGETVLKIFDSTNIEGRRYYSIRIPHDRDFDRDDFIRFDVFKGSEAYRDVGMNSYFLKDGKSIRYKWW